MSVLMVDEEEEDEMGWNGTQTRVKRGLEGTDNLVKRRSDAELLGLAGLDPPRGDLYAQKQVPVCLAPARSHSRKRGASLCTNKSAISTPLAKKKKKKRAKSEKEKKRSRLPRKKKHQSGGWGKMVGKRIERVCMWNK